MIEEWRDEEDQSWQISEEEQVKKGKEEMEARGSEVRAKAEREVVRILVLRRAAALQQC